MQSITQAFKNWNSVYFEVSYWIQLKSISRHVEILNRCHVSHLKSTGMGFFVFLFQNLIVEWKIWINGDMYCHRGKIVWKRFIQAPSIEYLSTVYCKKYRPGSKQGANRPKNLKWHSGLTSVQMAVVLVAKYKVTPRFAEMISESGFGDHSFLFIF